MGIKFLCPNGHKLHVKSFLKGKRAICPKCGVRVTVPDEEVAAADQDLPGDSAVELSLSTSQSAAAVAAPAVDTAAVPEPPSAPPPAIDAIDEAPDAVWYVRPATGGQFGPASGEIMRAWLNEGRVGASSLVWRAGWAEWRTATAAFPKLGPALAPPAIAAAAQAVNGASSGSAVLPVAQAVQGGTLGAKAVVPRDAEADTSATNRRRKRRRNDVSVLASVILAIVALILVIVLVIVWSGQNAEESDSSTSLAPTAVAAEQSAGLG